MNPISHEPLRLRQAPRCGAKNRAGQPCRAPRVKGKRRCWKHGGAPSSGAPKGERNGNYRHGRFPNEAIEGRRTLNALIKMML